ncbi:hypothetical protein J2861_001476 [Agrobacterium tumefaciens]|nr:hypothetical protein [Agrobacterium tumefaciens]
MKHTIEVKRLPRGEYTLEGAFYAQVDGRNVGDPGRAFWQTRKQAQTCGERFVAIVRGEDT